MSSATSAAPLPLPSYYEKCRAEIIRIMFKLEARKMASHPIFNAILIKRLFELWNLPNIQLQAGYFHDSSLIDFLVPYAWVTCTDEEGNEAITDITFISNTEKPIRAIGNEMDFAFLKNLEELVTEKDNNPMKDFKVETKYRYLTMIPPGFNVFAEKQADKDGIEKMLRKPNDFIDKCPKSYKDLYREITDEHTRPGDIDDELKVEVNPKNLNGLLRGNKKNP